jgi:hypothetical protein
MKMLNCVALRLVLLAGGAFVLMVGSDLANGQSLDEVNKRDEAVRVAWEKTPFAIRQALFVTGKPGGFGMYTPRPDTPFKAGEQLVVYAEPVAFGWKGVEDDQYEFGFTVDFVLKTTDGKIIGGQDKFANLIFKSRVQNREIFLKLDLDLTGATPGDYLLDFRIHDAEANKTAMIELPFTQE